MQRFHCAGKRQAKKKKSPITIVFLSIILGNVLSVLMLHDYFLSLPTGQNLRGRAFFIPVSEAWIKL